MDEKGNALVGVTVIVDNIKGAFTSLNGDWQLLISEGKHEIKTSQEPVSAN